MSPRQSTVQARAVGAIITLLLPSGAPGDGERLRNSLGQDWPRGTAAPEALPAPAPAAPAADPETTTRHTELRRKILAALGTPRLAGLTALTTAARKAEALDAPTALALLDGARPARSAAGHLAGYPVGPGADPEGPLAARLRELTARHLGADPSRWLGLYDALPDSRLTLPELLAELPEPQPARLTHPPKPVDATVRLLLLHAEPEAVLAALPQLPDTLLRTGPLPPAELIDALIERGDTRSRTALAGHGKAEPRLLKRLVALGDPRVDGAAYRNPRATGTLRRRIAARDNLDPGLLDWLLGVNSFGASATVYLAPLMDSGDPVLTLKGLWSDPRTVVQEYALLRIWERHGTEAIRELVTGAASKDRFKPGVTRKVQLALEHLAEHPELDGPTVLRRGIEVFDDPEVLVKRLHRVGDKSAVRSLNNEPYACDVAALAAEHRKQPYGAFIAEILLRHEDASDADRELFRNTVNNSGWRGERGQDLERLRPPLELLREHPVTHQHKNWLIHLLQQEVITPQALLDTARPASAVLAALPDVLRQNEQEQTDPLRTALDTAVREQLAGHPEAWLILLRLLPDFTGTLGELLGTVAVIAGERPDPRRLPDPAAEPEHVPAPGEEQAEPSLPAYPQHPPLTRPRPFRPPTRPNRWPEQAALTAIDLLRRLAEQEAGLEIPPPPADRPLLERLNRTHVHERPFGRSPDWLIKALEDLGDSELKGGGPAPTAAEIHHRVRTGINGIGTRSNFARSETEGTLAAADRACAAGLISPAELADTVPASILLQSSGEWSGDYLLPLLRRGLRTRLRTGLGADPDAWLRFLTLLTAARTPNTRSRAPLTQLLDAARHPNSPADPGKLLPAPPEAPATAEDVSWIGSDFWPWPTGEALLRADPEVLDALLPRLHPDTPWLLAAYLTRHHHGTEADTAPALEYLLEHGDAQVRHVLAKFNDFFGRPFTDRLLALNDPAVDLTLARSVRTVALKLRVLDAPTVLAPALLNRTGAARSPRDVLWLRSSEPELIEACFAANSGELDLLEQLTGCLHLARHGGPDRLAALRDAEGQLGATCHRLVVKALASADPVAVIEARAAKELTAQRLLKRLRALNSKGGYAAGLTAGRLLTMPYRITREELDAEHQRLPFNAKFLADVREQLGMDPPSPSPFRPRQPRWTQLQGPALALALDDRLAGLHPTPDAAADAVAAVGAEAVGGTDAGTGPNSDANPSPEPDLTARRLLHDHPDARQILWYLHGAYRRSGTLHPAPPRAAAALSELTRLIQDRLGTDPEAWHTVTRTLASHHPTRNPTVPVAELLLR